MRVGGIGVDLRNGQVRWNCPGIQPAKAMTPELSLVVVSYKMVRELPRTLFSLSACYQEEITRDDYEVLVVDNGSPTPPRKDQFRNLDLNLRVLEFLRPNPSPVDAINLGLNEARGRWIGVFIDGAHLASPGLLRSARQALRISPRAVVGSRGRYLGPGLQSWTTLWGYCREAEDALLAKARWTEDGYRLFAISVFNESSRTTWFDPVAETNSLFLARELWQELGGYDTRFASVGGGLVNLDTWSRACALPGIRPVILLGEATFHQVHDGTATNHPDPAAHWPRLCQEYEDIRGKPYKTPDVPLQFWGSFRHTPPSHELLGGWRSPVVRQMTYLQLNHLFRLLRFR